jgi:hypothetical protein
MPGAQHRVMLFFSPVTEAVEFPRIVRTDKKFLVRAVYTITVVKAFLNRTSAAT